MKEKGHTMKEVMGLVYASAEMQAYMDAAEKYGETNEIQQKVIEKGTETFWRMGKLELNSISRRVCEDLLRDPSVDKVVRQKRAHAIKIMGEIFTKIGSEQEEDQLSRRDVIQGKTDIKDGFLWKMGKRVKNWKVFFPFFFHLQYVT